MVNYLYFCGASLLPSHQPQFQYETVSTNLQDSVTRIPDGTTEDGYFITDIDMSERLITLTQADEFIRDEAEAGCINGQGTYIDGCWENDSGYLRFNLHAQWHPCGYYRLTPLGNFAPLEGQPCIETRNFMGALVFQNNSHEWNTLWPFVRMLTGVNLNDGSYMVLGGATQHEYEIAITVVKKNGLSGCWGGKNRVTAFSKWEADKTVLNHFSEFEWSREYITDSNGMPVHNIIWRIWNGAAVILPERIVHRPGFTPRRIFMAPEDIHYPIKRGTLNSDTVNVTLSLPRTELQSKELFLCYPGGANAVGICDLTLIRRAKKVTLLILNKQGIEGWKFAMGFAARLRREYINFTIRLLNVNEYKELSLKQFRKYLYTQNLVIPEELSDDFGGNLNAYLERKRTDLIPGVLVKGEVMLVTGRFCPEVAFYLANSVRDGSWAERWKSLKRCCGVTLFIDKYNLEKIAKTKKQPKVDVISGNISLSDAKQIVKDRSLVIFASQDIQNDKSRYHELLKFCLDHDISVIVFAERPDSFVQHIAGRFYELNCNLDAENRQYTFCSAETRFGVSFTLTPQGKLASCKDLNESEINELGTRQNILQVENGMKFIGNLSDEQIRETMFGNRLV